MAGVRCFHNFGEPFPFVGIVQAKADADCYEASKSYSSHLSGITNDKLQWLYYDGESPRIEPICCHNTEWDSITGQYSHLLPLTDASGWWISYTSARCGSSDVYVVEVGRFIAGCKY